MQSFAQIFMIIIPVIMVITIILTLIITFNPKIRGKFMANQMKATKYMFDESKETLEDMQTTVSNIAINSKKRILDENADVLEDIATKNANISKEGVEITARAIKKGLSKETIFCKHCGFEIDSDSKFCKACGKEL